MFVREDTPDTATKEDIDTFVALVKKIAPLCDFKAVIFSRSDEYNDVVNERVIHVKFNPDTNKHVILGCFDATPAVPVVEAPVVVEAPPAVVEAPVVVEAPPAVVEAPPAVVEAPVETTA